MNSFDSDIQNAWSSLQALFQEIQDKIKDWKESEKEARRRAEDEEEYEKYYSVDPEDVETQKVAGIGEEVYFLHELKDTVDLISWKLSQDNSKELEADFSELISICSELGLDLEDEFEQIQSYLDVLSFEEGTLIYVPKRNLIHTPQLILEVNDDLIKKIAREPDLLFQISPRKFEEIIADVFFKRGFEIELTKSTRDGGRDIIAFYDHMNIKTKYLIECKRYAKTNKVSIGIVQRLFGVKMAEAANKAILATTSTFTRDARHFASSHVWDLDLKDYEHIMAWIKAYGR